MYCGFLSIGFTVSNSYKGATWLIIIGIILDALDGRLARLLNVKSDLGTQLDSLADIVTFGIAPALLFSYTNSIGGGWLDISLAGLFVLCGGYRLARFNSAQSEETSFFTGVPITAAGGILAITTLFHTHLPPMANLLIIALLSYAMVSTIRIPSLKNITLPNHKTMATILIGIVLLLFDRRSIVALYLTAIYFMYVAYRIMLMRANRNG